MQELLREMWAKRRATISGNKRRIECTLLRPYRQSIYRDYRFQAALREAITGYNNAYS